MNKKEERLMRLTSLLAEEGLLVEFLDSLGEGRKPIDAVGGIYSIRAVMISWAETPSGSPVWREFAERWEWIWGSTYE